MRVWKWLFYLILLIFPFGQLASFYSPFKDYYFRGQLIDFGCLFFVFYWFIFTKKAKPPFFLKSLAVFGVTSGISLAVKAFSLPSGGLITAFLYLLRLYCWIVFFWAMCDFLKKEKININILLIYAGTAVAFFSFLQYVFLPDTRFLYFLGWDDHLFRAIGAFLDPSFNGLVLVLSFILCLKILLEKKQKYFYVFVLITIFITVGIGLTFSRMSYFLLIISLFIILMFKKKYKLLLLFLSTFALLIFIIPKPKGEGVDLLRKSTSFAKINNYSQILSISKDNLFIGVGYNTLRNESYKRGFLTEKNWQENHAGAGADNSFLFVLATTGVFGLLSYLIFWFKIVRKSIKKKEIFFLTTNVCLLLSAFFINSLFYPWLLCWWGICLAKFTAEIEA